MPGTTFATGNWTGYDEQSVTNPSSALTDFTLAVDISTLSSTWKSEVQSDGGDIRLTKGDNTELPFDLIDWAYNAGAPTGLIRVKWSSTLAASGTQNVRIWAGYTGGTAVAYDDTETYGADNAYDANWTLYLPDGGFGGLGDRTSNARTATAVGGVSAGDSTGRLGVDATEFDGASDAFTLADIDIFNSVTAVTIMTYCYNHVIGSNEVIFADWTLGSDKHILLRTENDLEFFVYDNASTQLGGDVTTGTPLTANTWQHVAARFDGAATELKGWVDDAGSATLTGPSALNSADSGAIYLGRTGHNGTDHYNGLMLDFQLHLTARADEWIEQEEAQLSDQSTFWGTWAWTAQGGGGGAAVPKGSLSLLGVGR